MPTYEFRCPNGHEFEHFFRKISDSAPELPCPQCGAMAKRQLSGGAGLLFKGSGFYLTDYGRNAHRKGAAAKTGDDNGKPAESKTESKAEGKPADAGSTSTPASDSTTPAKKSDGKTDS